MALPPLNASRLAPLDASIFKLEGGGSSPAASINNGMLCCCPNAITSDRAGAESLV